MNAITLISQLANNAEQSVSLTNTIVNEILSGEYNPLSYATQLRLNIDALENALKHEDVKSAIFKELEKYEGSKHDNGIFRFERGSKSTFDFTVCNDSAWNDLNEKMETLKAKLKERENFLKALKPEMGVFADAESGEVICPPAKKTTDFVKFTLKK